MKKEILVILLLLCSSAFNAVAQQQQQAERSIDKAFIYPNALIEPQPQGVVDENSPWLHFRVPYAANKSEDKEFTHRRYFFKLSQDSTFTHNVIRSKPKSWSFYNPYRILETGKWYWTYGVALDSDPDAIAWNERVYSFVITGNERQVVYPTPEALLAKVKSLKGPHVMMLKEDIGKLLPENHPELKQRLLKDFQKLLADTGQYKIVVDTTDYPRHLTKSGIHRYFTLNTLKQFTRLSDNTRMLLYAYLLTGNEAYKKKGLEAFYSLDHEYRTSMMRYSVRPGFPDDFTVEQHTKTMNLILDAFSEELSDKWRNQIVELLYKIKKEGYMNYYKQLEFSEHEVYKAHLWQMCVYTLLSSSIILSPYKEEAGLWAEYAYELWLYRNPAGGRNDGGWHAGNGYFGANERQLTFTPLFLSKLMDYNYFDHPWYQQVAKYLTYSTPYGNPGLAFGDGVGCTGSAQRNLVEVLTHLYPDNPWNSWRMKTAESVEKERKKFNLAQESIWSLLDIWNKFKQPDYQKAEAPKELAAVFPDIGYVGMHTDFEHPEKNLLVNFRSCPFGQLNHAHPAQNAFNIAYGSEPLFWRTGHYATLQAHTELCFKHSRAHNTILANDMGQVCDVSGYGWIPRFVTGEKISYALGDASHAYSGSDKKVHEQFLRKAKPEASQGAGSEDPGVTRYRRHIARLRPNYVVVYDELEANEAINWSFQLNARENMLKEKGNHISTYSRVATADAYVFCNEKLEVEVTDQFLAPPIDVQGKLGKGKDRFPNHWHGSFTTIGKHRKVRLLTIIEVTPEGEKRVFRSESVKDADGYSVWNIGAYRVKAQMQADKPSLLEIVDETGTCALLTGQAARTTTLNGQSYKTSCPGSTLLIEKQQDGKVSVTEKTDTLPDAVIYGNQY